VCHIIQADVDTKDGKVEALEGLMAHLSSMTDEELEHALGNGK
jgi:hypothetical protein